MLDATEELAQPGIAGCRVDKFAGIVGVLDQPHHFLRCLPVILTGILMGLPVGEVLYGRVRVDVVGLAAHPTPDILHLSLSGAL